MWSQPFNAAQHGGRVKGDSPKRTTGKGRCHALLAAVALSVLCTLTLEAATADIHKWVDPDGTVHYSDAPPPNVETTKLPAESEISIVPSEGRDAEYWAKKAKEFQDRYDARLEAEAREQARVAQAQAEEKAKLCEFAQRDLAQVLATRQRVAMTMDGEIVAPSADQPGLNNFERNRLVGALEEFIKSSCN